MERVDCEILLLPTFWCSYKTRKGILVGDWSTVEEMTIALSSAVCCTGFALVRLQCWRSSWIPRLAKQKLSLSLSVSCVSCLRVLVFHSLCLHLQSVHTGTVPVWEGSSCHTMSYMSLALHYNVA